MADGFIARRSYSGEGPPTPHSLFAPVADRLTVLYDEDCGFCRWSAAQLRALDRRRRRLELVPLQHAAAHPARPELASLAAARDLRAQIHVLRRDGSVRAGGAAMLEILDALPGGWLLRPWRRLPGVEALVDAGYRWVAGRRDTFGRLLAARAGEGPTCTLDRPAKMEPVGSALIAPLPRTEES